MTAPRAESSPRRTARIAGVCYLLTIATGSLTLAFGGNASAAGRALSLASAACYVVVTLLFLRLFEPVGRRLSFLAALTSIAGCAAGAAGTLHLGHSPVNSLAFFGVYCLLIGWLILRSTFLPAVLGVMMAIGGAGWLTFAFPPLAHRLSPFNMAPGILGEGALTLWLLVVGVSEERWKEQARARVS